MPTTVYRNKRGDRLPSVTQVLSASWSKGEALIQWANREGLQGRKYTDTRDVAATTGTIAHALVLARMGGPQADVRQYSLDEVRAAKIPAHHASDWLDGRSVEAIVVEEPLVSSKLGFGGTPDWYGILDGKRTLLDIKTSARIYPVHYVQLAAYALLLDEAGHKVDRVGILHLPKLFSGHARDEYVPEGDKLDRFRQAWDACFSLYKIQNIVGF
jgi:CRISPR/Cas system-associated exonuclease Cas4 (RecB family)